MAHVDENYIDSLSAEDARRELKYTLERYYGILYALRDAPELPEPYVLIALSHAAKYPTDNNVGRKLQRELGSERIPFKHECEGGAGLWQRIRRGLIDGEGLDR